jgi:dihydroorotase
MRVALREPGFRDKGSIASETRAAVASGITSVCCTPDTRPVIDSPSVVEWIHQRAEAEALAKVYVLGAATSGLGVDQLANMSALKQAGCLGVSNGLVSLNTEVMRRVLEYASSQEMTVFIHSEDEHLRSAGCMHEGRVSVRLGLPAIPEFAETVAVTRDLQLVELTDARAHLCHLSSDRAVKILARAQYDGLNVSADVAISHLFLTEVDVAGFNTCCHVRPPLRTQRDQDGLKQGLQRNTISVICSDHQPHDYDAKSLPFPSSEPGISSIEALLPLSLRLTREGVLKLPDLIAKLTCNPAKVLGIDAGSLSVGSSADICVFDPQANWIMQADQLLSRGKNSPFIGWEMQGRVNYTLQNGNVVFQRESAE